MVCVVVGVIATVRASFSGSLRKEISSGSPCPGGYVRNVFDFAHDTSAKFNFEAATEVLN